MRLLVWIICIQRSKCNLRKLLLCSYRSSTIRQSKYASFWVFVMIHLSLLTAFDMFNWRNYDAPVYIYLATEKLQKQKGKDCLKNWFSADHSWRIYCAIFHFGSVCVINNIAFKCLCDQHLHTRSKKRLARPSSNCWLNNASPVLCPIYWRKQ